MPDNNPVSVRRKGSYSLAKHAGGLLPCRTNGSPGLPPYLRDPVPPEAENPNMRSVDPLDPPGRFPLPPGDIEIKANSLEDTV